MAEAAGVVGAALGPPQAASAPWQLEEEGADSARPAAMSWGAPGPVGGEAVVASAPVMAEGLGAVLVLGVLLEALGVALVVVLEALGGFGALGAKHGLQGTGSVVALGLSCSAARGSSRTRDRTCVSCTAGRFFTTKPPGKPSLLVFQLFGPI